MSKSLNKVILIGNLTRDPELKYTPQGTAVCPFGIATNRQWVTESGEKKDEVEFHKCVAWGKLAEICGKLLAKGRKVYLEGRLQTRTWAGQDGSQRSTTEVVVSDMILLDSKRETSSPDAVDFNVPEDVLGDIETTPDADKSGSKEKSKSKEEKKEEEIEGEDIPF